jgi:hypothetical protein
MMRGGWSFYGTGVRLHGLEPEPPDLVVVTHWLTLFFIPVAPLRRVKCRYEGEVLSEGGMDSALRFEIVERLPLSWSSVCATYLWNWIALLVTLGPVAFLIWRTQGRAATTAEMALLLGCIIVLGLLPFYVEWRQKQVLEGSWRREKQEAVQHAQAAQAVAVLSAWQSKHVLSERFFLLAGIVGLVPGVAAVLWWGLPVPLEAGAIGGAALALGIVYAIDRLLVRLRERTTRDRGGAHSAEWR